METGQGSARLASTQDVATARAALQPLLDLLRSLPPREGKQGSDAADTIERHIRPGFPLMNFWSTLSYDIGGKGLLDWNWSPETLAGMQPVLDAANEVIRAGQADERQTRTAP